VLGGSPPLIVLASMRRSLRDVSAEAESGVSCPATVCASVGSYSRRRVDNADFSRAVRSGWIWTWVHRSGRLAVRTGARTSTTRARSSGTAQTWPMPELEPIRAQFAASR
jgi:hypothetical protein